MHALNHLALKIVAVSTLLLTIQATSAQDKAPPREAPKPVQQPIDIDAFAAVYNAAGRPVMLTLVGFSTGQREAEKVEKTLWDTDTSGFTFQLRAAFNEFINPPEVNMELVSPTQLADAVRRVQNQLSLNRENEAVALIAEESRADNIILIRLFGDAGSPTRGQVELTNARGRELFSFPFQWSAGMDTASIRATAFAIAREFTADYAKRGVAPAQIWTVRLFDFNDPEALQELRATLAEDQEIKSVRNRRSASARDSYRELEITASLDPLDLEVAISRAIKGRGLVAKTESTDAGVINIRVKPLPPVPVPGPVTIADCGEAIADLNSGDGRAFRKELLEVYNRRGQPAIAVMVNRRPFTVSEQRKAEAAQPGNVSAQTMVVVAGSSSIGSGTAAPTPPANGATADEEFRTITELNNLNVSLEGHMYDMLGTDLLDFNRRIAPVEARARIFAQAASHQDFYSQTELAELIRRSKVADLFLDGTGTLEIDAVTGSYSARYTFYLKTLDGTVLGAAPDLKVSAALSDSGALRELARGAMSKLACQLLNEWRKDPQVTVELKGVTANTDWLSFSQIVKENAKLFRIVGDESDAKYGPSDGFVKFNITYKAGTPAVDIQSELLALNKKLPFDLVYEGGTASTGLTLQVKRRN